MPIPCRSIATCASSPRGRRRTEEARVPHRLYGHVDAAENYSVGALAARCARRARARRRAQGALPIFVGGTGLYFKALTQGLAAIPPIPPDVRSARRAARLAAEGVAALHAELAAARSGVTAARLMPGDRARIARALEVVLATGRSLTDWHREGLPPRSIRSSAIKVFLEADREELYRRIDARFDAMLAAGALDEVRALRPRLDPRCPP